MTSKTTAPTRRSELRDKVQHVRPATPFTPQEVTESEPEFRYSVGTDDWHELAEQPASFTEARDRYAKLLDAYQKAEQAAAGAVDAVPDADQRDLDDAVAAVSAGKPVPAPKHRQAAEQDVAQARRTVEATRLAAVDALERLWDIHVAEREQWVGRLRDRVDALTAEIADLTGTLERRLGERQHLVDTVGQVTGTPITMNPVAVEPTPFVLDLVHDLDDAARAAFA